MIIYHESGDNVLFGAYLCLKITLTTLHLYTDSGK